MVVTTTPTVTGIREVIGTIIRVVEIGTTIGTLQEGRTTVTGTVIRVEVGIIRITEKDIRMGSHIPIIIHLIPPVAQLIKDQTI